MRLRLRVYRALQVLLPRDLRERYGAEMLDLLERRLVEARSRWRRARIWWGSVIDVVAEAAGAVLRRGTTERDGSTPLGRCVASKLARDARLGARSLLRSPGFTLATVLTLGLAIGANSAVFAALDAVLLRDLPFPEGDRLMRLSQTEEGTEESAIAPIRLEDWARLSTAFEAVSGYYTEDVSETSGDVPVNVRRAMVAPRFLDVWGVAPSVGRGYVAGDHRGSSPVVLVSDRYWRGRLGADPAVLTREVRLGTGTYPIVGVMPADFMFPDRAVDLWFPVSLDNPVVQDRTLHWYTGVGRLAPGVSIQAARTELAAVQAGLEERHPGSDDGVGVRIDPLKDTLVAGVRGSLWLTFGAVSVLLLIACTNIATLLITRATQRRREVSVRLSLGASRSSIAGQVLTETALLALAGALVGALMAWTIMRSIDVIAGDVPRADEIALDGRMLIYMLVAVAAVTMLCGFLPALRSSREDFTAGLAGAGRARVSGDQSAQWSLVGVQVALSVALLTSAGLLVQSFIVLSRTDAGFETDGVLTFRVTGSYAETMDYDRLVARFEHALDALTAMPGIDGAATTMLLPGVPNAYETEFSLAGADGLGARTTVLAESRIVSPGYFETMRIPLLAGETCRRQPAEAVPQLMVNQAFADRFLTASTVVGRVLPGAGLGQDPRITGIVGDARERGVDQAAVPTVYTCFSAPNPFAVFLVRTRDGATGIVDAIRHTMKELEPTRALYDVAMLQDRIDGAFAQNRGRTLLLTLFAATAVALACVGVYGTLAYTVRLRRREIGLRLALGAQRGDIVLRHVGKAMLVIGLACAAGLGLTLLTGRALAGMLYGVSASDPFTMAGVVALMAGIAGLAAFLPALRAALVEPMRALREQ